MQAIAHFAQLEPHFRIRFANGGLHFTIGRKKIGLKEENFF